MGRESDFMGWLDDRVPAFRFFHAGDTGYSRDFADIRQGFGPIDLAALPVGGYAPRWFMHINHLDPDEAVAVYRDLGARFSVGIHWGTFADLTDELLDEPPKRLADALTRPDIVRAFFPDAARRDAAARSRQWRERHFG